LAIDRIKIAEMMFKGPHMWWYYSTVFTSCISCLLWLHRYLVPLRIY